MSHVRSSIPSQVVLISIDSPLSWFSIRLNKPKRSQMGPWIVWAHKNWTSGRVGQKHEGAGRKGHCPFCSKTLNLNAHLGTSLYTWLCALEGHQQEFGYCQAACDGSINPAYLTPVFCMRSTLAVTKAE